MVVSPLTTMTRSSGIVITILPTIIAAASYAVMRTLVISMVIVFVAPMTIVSAVIIAMVIVAALVIAVIIIFITVIPVTVIFIVIVPAVVITPVAIAIMIWRRAVDVHHRAVDIRRWIIGIGINLI